MPLSSNLSFQNTYFHSTLQGEITDTDIKQKKEENHHLWGAGLIYYMYFSTHMRVLLYPLSEAVRHTWLQTTCGSRPAHDRRDRTHYRSHPGVGDAEPLQRRVATSVEKDVEGPQEARQWVNCQREQSDPGDATGQGKGHGMQRTGTRTDRETERGFMRISSIVCFFYKMPDIIKRSDQAQEKSPSPSGNYGMIWMCVFVQTADKPSVASHTHRPTGATHWQSAVVSRQEPEMNNLISDKNLSRLKVALRDEEHVHTREIKTS